MFYFSIVDEATVICRSKGVFFQRKIYVRGKRLYMEHGKGFVQLKPNGVTSVPNLRWEDMHFPLGQRYVEVDPFTLEIGVDL